MKYFPERLKAARKMNGYSLQDLSDVIGNQFNKQSLQRLETGEAKPDSQTISLLSKALHLPSDYFVRETVVQLEELRFRKLKKLPAKEVDKISALTVDYLERYLELEDMLGLDNKISFIPKTYPLKNEDDIEKAVLYLRKKWKLGEDALTNIIDILEENGVKVFLLNTDPSFSGMSSVLNGKVAVIVLNENREIPIVRRRFSALHELAHLYLDLSGFDEKRAETICDRFAASMLIVPHKLMQILGNKRTSIVMQELYFIAGKYGISLSAIAYQAMRLGIVTNSFHRFFMIRYNRFKTKDKEHLVYSGKENSNRFFQLLFRAVAEEIISASKAASLNNQRLGDFRELLDNAVK
ncbi:MAG TPA: XRE family transcriptional regulator [Puia sp.]|jgi:Zn-dependent peptidase ImmA (M78 family)/DNA-binding XRE family transcriptional regulator